MVRCFTDPLKRGESLRDDRKNTLDRRVQCMPVKMSNTIEISYQKTIRLKINRYVFTASAETLPMLYRGDAYDLRDDCISGGYILYCTTVVRRSRKLYRFPGSFFTTLIKQQDA